MNRIAQDFKKPHPSWPFLKPLTFGDKDQIKWLREQEKIISGENAVHVWDWERSFISHDGINEVEAVQDGFQCPKCGEDIHYCLEYNSNDFLVERWIHIDAEVEHFKCQNCELEFFTEDGEYVYVNSPTHQLTN